MIWNTVEFRVGFLVVAVVVMVFSLSVLVSKGPGLFKSSKIIVFDVDDASGLIRNGVVKAYGISVGVIKDIQLVDRKARVYLKLSEDFQLTKSASIRIRHQGILGDKYIEIFMGHPKDPLLKHGDSISDIKMGGDVEGILNLVSDGVLSIKNVAQILKDAFDGRDDREEGEESPSTLGRILEDTEVFMANLSRLSGESFDKTNEILRRLDHITVKLDEFVRVGGIENLETSIKNVEEITSQVSEGRGTLGRLIYEDEALDEINRVALNMNEYLGDVSRLQTSFDFHTEYLQRFGNFKSFFSFKVKPGLDRYYELKLVSDSEGVIERTSTRTSNSVSEEVVDEEKFFKSKLKLSALMAKNFYDFTLKAGMIENSAGLGVDYYLLNKKLKLALELYNMSQTKMRAFMRFNLVESFYIIGGGNNIFSKRKDMSPFIGAGLFITNDDIKTLVSKVSF